MNETDVLDRLSQSLAGIHMRTRVEEILARSRIRRRRRLTAVVAGGVGVALTVALAVVNGSGRSGSSDHLATPQLVAFTVVNGPNGSSALTLRKGEQYRLDPAALRQALAQHGVAAVVNVGKMCDTNPEPEGLDRVISSRRLADGSVFTTFNPAAMPAGRRSASATSRPLPPSPSSKAANPFVAPPTRHPPRGRAARPSPCPRDRTQSGSGPPGCCRCRLCVADPGNRGLARTRPESPWRLRT